jgi:hypothetical protein
MENKIVLSNLLHRPIRTGISVLAVAIEVGMVLLVVGLTSGMLNDSAKRQEGVGAEVLVQPPNSSYFIAMSGAPMPIKIGDLIAQRVPHVESVTPVLVIFSSTGGLNMIYGIDMTSFDAVSRGFVYLSGGPFKGPYDILVDDWYAKANHVKVGESLNFLNHEFHVAGIVEHGKGARLFIPLATAQARLQGAFHSGIHVADDLQQPARAECLHQRHGGHRGPDRVSGDFSFDVHHHHRADAGDWHPQIAGGFEGLHRGTHHARNRCYLRGGHGGGIRRDGTGPEGLDRGVSDADGGVPVVPVGGLGRSAGPGRQPDWGALSRHEGCAA